MRHIVLYLTLLASFWSFAFNTQAQDSVNHGPALKIEDVDQVAKDILDLFDSSSEKYSVSDGLNLAFYIIRTFAVAGTYDLSGEDLKALVNTFEELTNERLREEVHFILNSIKLIKFREINGLPTAIFTTVSPNGIRYPINDVRPDSSVKEIKDLVIANGASISFDRVNGPNDRELLRTFVLEKIKIFPIPKGWLDALNQINPSIDENIRAYLKYKEDKENGPHPLLMGFNGFTLNVSTTTLFGDMELNFVKGYSLPNLGTGGLRGENSEALPGFMLELKGGILKIRVSLDQ